MASNPTRFRDRIEEPHVGRAAVVGLCIVLGAVLIASLLSLAGCSAGLPVVRVTHIEGAGSIDLETCTEHDDGTVSGCIPHSLAFASEGRDVVNADGESELIHCAVIRRLTLVGIPFGRGLLPHPLSDERCEGAAFDPFPGISPTLRPE